jgi:hypothetical protein
MVRSSLSLASTVASISGAWLETGDGIEAGGGSGVPPQAITSAISVNHSANKTVCLIPANIKTIISARGVGEDAIVGYPLAVLI